MQATVSVVLLCGIDFLKTFFMKFSKIKKFSKIEIAGFAVLIVGLLITFGVGAGLLKTSLVSVQNNPTSARCRELKEDWDYIDPVIVVGAGVWTEEYPAGGYTHRWDLAYGDLENHLVEPDACERLYPDIWKPVATTTTGATSSGAADVISLARCEVVKKDWYTYDYSGAGSYTSRWIAKYGNDVGHLDEPRQCEYLYNEMWHQVPADAERIVMDSSPSGPVTRERCAQLKFWWEEGDFTKRFVNKGKASMDEVGECISQFYPDSWDKPTNLGRFEDAVFTFFSSSPFPDMNVNNAEGLAAAELQRRKVINGRPDGQFYGSDPVNRAEAAKFLLLSKNIDVPEASNGGRFSDVVDGEWYVKYVITAANLGIIKGDEGKTTFRPADKVNTAEFLKILSKTFELEEDLPYTYDDVQSGEWFSIYAGAAEKYELFPRRLKWLAPGNYLSREEVAVAIYNYLANRE